LIRGISTAHAPIPKPFARKTARVARRSLIGFNDQTVDGGRWPNNERRRCHQLFGRHRNREHAARFEHGAFEFGIFGIEGGNAFDGIEGARAQEADVGFDLLDLQQCSRPERARDIAADPAADENDVETRPIQQTQASLWRVCHDGQPCVVRKRLRDRNIGRTRIQQDHLPGLHDRRSSKGKALLAIHICFHTRRCVQMRRRSQQGAPVHALAQPGAREVAQVAADGVFRRVEFGRDFGRQHPALGSQTLEDELLALVGQQPIHGVLSASLHLAILARLGKSIINEHNVSKTRIAGND